MANRPDINQDTLQTPMPNNTFFPLINLSHASSSVSPVQYPVYVYSDTKRMFSVIESPPSSLSSAIPHRGPQKERQKPIQDINNLHPNTSRPSLPLLHLVQRMFQSLCLCSSHCKASSLNIPKEALSIQHNRPLTLVASVILKPAPESLSPNLIFCAHHFGEECLCQQSSNQQNNEELMPAYITAYFIAYQAHHNNLMLLLLSEPCASVASFLSSSFAFFQPTKLLPGST